jgi:hypothetical protein
MTGVVRKATFLAILGLAAVVSVAGAGVPDPAHCTIPTAIHVGGCDGVGNQDPNVYFEVTIRDIGNFPVVNQLVACEFNADLRVEDNVAQFVSCQCFEATTDANGVARFYVAAGGKNTNGTNTVNTGALAATFYGWNCGNALVLGQANVAIYDENGGITTLGVDITDLGAWVADYNNRGVPPTQYRSDFNLSGAVDIVDLSRWVQVYNSQLSKYACGTLCP